MIANVVSGIKTAVGFGSTTAGGKIDARRVLRMEEGQTPCRVLIAEDTVDSRLMLVQLLKNAGFEVLEADNGNQALELFTNWHPRLMLMDNRMSGMDGDETTRRIRCRPGRYEAKIITLTAFAVDEVRGQTLAAGADDFLSKPFRQNELFEKIRLLTGVRYVYAESPEQKQTAVQESSELSMERMATISPELCSRLQEAAAGGRYGRLLDLIRQIAPVDSELSEKLQDLVVKFEYEALLKLLAR